MNATSAPSHQKTAPEKGSFPLDHFGECKPLMKEYLKCMRMKQSIHIDCKHISKEYLQCRMGKGLMQVENLQNLGFHADGMRKTESRSDHGKKEGEGFIAGLGVKRAKNSDKKF